MTRPVSRVLTSRAVAVRLCKSERTLEYRVAFHVHAQVKRNVCFLGVILKNRASLETIMSRKRSHTRTMYLYHRNFFILKSDTIFSNCYNLFCMKFWTKLLLLQQITSEMLTRVFRITESYFIKKVRYKREILQTQAVFKCFNLSFYLMYFLKFRQRVANAFIVNRWALLVNSKFVQQDQMDLCAENTYNLLVSRHRFR